MMTRRSIAVNRLTWDQFITSTGRKLRVCRRLVLSDDAFVMLGFCHG
ncbi:MAG: hypothetical protein ABIN69_08310 [Aestuariivirga sp.]